MTSFMWAVLLQLLAQSIDSINAHDTSTSMRIAFGSCHNQHRAGLWDIVRSYEPEKLILLGDNLYADKRSGPAVGYGRFEEATIEDLANDYKLLGEDESFSRLVDGMGGMEQSVYAIYDDHDYGINNGDAKYEHKRVAAEHLNNFFSIQYNESRRESFGDGVYSSHTISIPMQQQQRQQKKQVGAGDDAIRIKLIMLDVRFNRKNAEDQAKCDLLGAEQWRWLEQEMARSIGKSAAAASRGSCAVVGSAEDAPQCAPDEAEAEAEVEAEPVVDLILIGSGTQVLPVGKLIEETWSKDCNRDRERLLGLIASTVKESKAGTTEPGDHVNVLLLSGDVHGAEYSQAFCDMSSATEAAGKGTGDVEGRRANGASISLQGSSYYHLRELTCSGFTHTFTHHTALVNRSADGGAAIRSGDASPVPITSRGAIAEWVYDLYQRITPTHHRADKVRDHFHYPHFGLLDVKHEANSHVHRHRRFKKLAVDFRVISHEQEVVMQHLIDFGSAGGDDSGSGGGLVVIPSSTSVCSLYHGDVPLYKRLWTRAAVALWAMIFIVTPVLTVLWFICASIYYICIGAELKRRHRILEANRAKILAQQ